MIRINIHVHGVDHGDRSAEVLEKLDDLGRAVQQLQKKVSMSVTKGDFDGLRVAMFEATNKIAARIAAIEAKLAAGGMTADEEQAVFSELGELRTALEALGADPENPVPTN